MFSPSKLRHFASQFVTSRISREGYVFAILRPEDPEHPLAECLREHANQFLVGKLDTGSIQDLDQGRS
jgi:hypothetical protein